MNIREEILRLLEEKRRDALAGKGTGALSGESAAKRLGVSRAAVWKAVSALRKEGYNVNAATRRGYSLDKSSDTLTEEGVRACLTPDGPVRRVICLETVDSTNNYAKKLTNAENGTLIIANQQTAGRGRRGHSFVSPPGTGLYMTLVLRPSGAGENPLRREGYRSGGWTLLDFGCVIVHIFSEEMRQFYALDRLWSDAEKVDLEDLLD